MILDTSVVIEKIKNKEEIKENITSVTLIEYPPIKDYEKFFGRIYFVSMEDQILAFEMQKKLRKLGKSKSFPDLIIAAVCINRNETLLTRDKDFNGISKIFKEFRVVVL